MRFGAEDVEERPEREVQVGEPLGGARRVLGQGLEPGQAVVLAVHRAIADQAALLAHKEEEQPVHEVEELTVEVAGRELAGPNLRPQGLVLGVTEEPVGQGDETRPTASRSLSRIRPPCSIACW